ncbi:MAG TPA: response regulator [Terriglobia bacterium]|jgi:FixJ family two-component response regulator|nr:response regulator [Terriglobia bacterium]
MIQSEPQIYIVQNDPSIRNALRNLLKSVDLHAQFFTSALEFKTAERPDILSCLILDVRLPGMSGLDLQLELNRANIPIPIIFVTGHGDIPMAVRAMKAGAVEFLTKPFRDQDLLDAVHVALDRDRLRRSREHQTAALNGRLKLLTARERELLPWVVSGRPNKEIAAELGMSEITVKVHRGKLMRKMQAPSFADLVRMASDLKIPTRK